MTKPDSVTLTPTTPEDVKRFLPNGLPWRIRALTAKRGDEILGIGGIAMLPDGTVAAFLEASEVNAKKYRLTLHKAALRIMKQVKDIGFGSIVTECDTKRDAAARYLERLGFSPLGTIEREAQEIEVWKWQA